MSGKKVLRVIIFLLACAVLWGIALWVLLITPINDSCHWLLEDTVQFFIPLIWVFGTLVIVGERK